MTGDFMYKISIIMPVYNTPKEYLEAVVQSILAQTYRSFELIIVDDGSGEETAALCDLIAGWDEKIQVIHQVNQGVSAARNNGAEIATGDYVMYADSDDVLYEKALAECVKAIETTGADFVFGGIKKMADSTAVADVPHRDEPEYMRFDKDSLDEVKRSFMGQNNPVFQNVFGGGSVNRGPCARALRTDIAKTLPFNHVLKIGEDVVWNMQVLNTISEACFVNSVWYGYVTYGESAINRYYGNRAEILGTYLTVLFENDPDFCQRHMKEYLSNMAAAFHTVLSHDFMSASCPLSGREKRRAVRDIMVSAPWNKMIEKGNFQRLSLKHKVLVKASYAGVIFSLLKVLGM